MLTRDIEGKKVPKIGYEVYYPLNGTFLTKLDLSVCQKDEIIVLNPIIINDSLDKYNPKSDYYNDICYTFTTENGTDISLKDRREEYIKDDKALCEENCIFEDYDFTINKSICSCEVKINIPIISQITIDKDKLIKSFTDIKNIAILIY